MSKFPKVSGIALLLCSLLSFFSFRDGFSVIGAILLCVAAGLFSAIIFFDINKRAKKPPLPQPQNTELAIFLSLLLDHELAFIAQKFKILHREETVAVMSDVELLRLTELAPADALVDLHNHLSVFQLNRVVACARNDQIPPYIGQFSRYESLYKFDKLDVQNLLRVLQFANLDDFAHRIEMLNDQTIVRFLPYWLNAKRKEAHQ